jgi:hypothetical protein
VPQGEQMTVTDDQVAALRAALTGDMHAFDGLGGVSGLDYGEAFPVLMATAFILATRRRFGGGWSTADVIRFVGEVRLEYDANDGCVDPDAAEQLVLAALRDKALPAGIGEEARGNAQFALLSSMVSDEYPQSHELDALLAEARELADQWMAGQARA